MTHSCWRPRPPPARQHGQLPVAYAPIATADCVLGCLFRSRPDDAHDGVALQRRGLRSGRGMLCASGQVCSRTISIDSVHASRRPLHASVAGGRRTGSISSSSAAVMPNTASHCSQHSSSTDCSRPSGIFSPPTTRVMATRRLRTPSSSLQWPTSRPPAASISFLSFSLSFLSPFLFPIVLDPDFPDRPLSSFSSI